MCVSLLYSINKGCETCTMYDTEAKYGVEGLWFEEGYYCIWTDWVYKHDNETVSHEQCHQMVWDEYDHFCNITRP